MTSLYRWHATITRGSDRISVCDSESQAAAWLRRRMREAREAAVDEGVTAYVVDSLNRGIAETYEGDTNFCWLAGGEVYQLQRLLAVGHRAHLDADTWEAIREGWAPGARWDLWMGIGGRPAD
jgi:hypothetical protein